MAGGRLVLVISVLEDCAHALEARSSIMVMITMTLKTMLQCIIRTRNLRSNGTLFRGVDSRDYPRLEIPIRLPRVVEAGTKRRVGP
jgi:hypothetical protein